MSGKYGAIQFVVGKPSKQKPVQCQPCAVCAKECYRQTYTPRAGWKFRHYSCDPIKAKIERHRTRTGATQAYVPREYDGSGFDPAIGAAIQRQRGR